MLDKNDYQMIGYAADETTRHKNLGDKKQSIMFSLGVNEKDTFDICRKYNLLSPLYDLGIKRDGCFFCPNVAKRERELLHKTRPDLVQKIYGLIEMTDFEIPKVFNNWIKDYYEQETDD